MKRSLLFKYLGLPLLGLCISTHAHAAMAKHKHIAKSLLGICQSQQALPSPHCGRTPSIAFDTNQGRQSNKAYVVFSQHSHIYLSTTEDLGQTYSTPLAINPRAEKIYDDGENRPKILLGPNQSIFITWTEKTAGRYSGNVRFAKSTDGGKSFSNPVTINNDLSLIGHRFDSMAINAEGRLYIFWIDKRDRYASDQRLDKQSETAQLNELNTNPLVESYRGASVYYTYSDDLGESFVNDMKWIDHSCECCRLSLKPDAQGNLALLWRHVYPDNIRDHAISYISPGFKNTSLQPRKLADDQWQLEGCPHHGPDMSFSPNNKAHTVWFSQGKHNQGIMYTHLQIKKNQSSPVISIDPSPGASRPQVQAINNKVFVVWKHFDGSSMNLMLKQSHDSGKTWSTNKVIAKTEYDSDHPDLVVNNNDLYATWHTQAEGLRWLKIQ